VRRAVAETADIAEPSALAGDLQARGRAGETLRLDQATAAEALAQIVAKAGGKVARGPDPITLMKAVKNEAEIAGARAAHARDGVAMARFLAWFDREAPQGNLTEIDCVAALETFRRQTGALRDVSFPTIAGAGPNGAIVHYRVTRASNRRLRPGELFLLDSGAQYVDGTTDITRTVAVGEPDAAMRVEMRERFTRVLKGHIAIARAVFPDGIAGGQLDGFARQHLWAAGLDYAHGTGHGIGSYLSVHEGPASIHKSNLVPLKRGMILSNEPGYYKTGAYGIRIENLVLVVAGPQTAGADAPLNAFETLSFAPIDRRLIATALLTSEEIAWLDAYHRRTQALVRAEVDADTRRWLDEATAPLAP
jgi:Xaa-Pro aminopeptidase